MLALGNLDFPWRSPSCRNVTAGPTGNTRGGNVFSPVVNIMMFSNVTVHSSSESGGTIFGHLSVYTSSGSLGRAICHRSLNDIPKQVNRSLNAYYTIQSITYHVTYYMQLSNKTINYHATYNMHWLKSSCKTKAPTFMGFFGTNCFHAKRPLNWIVASSTDRFCEGTEHLRRLASQNS